LRVSGILFDRLDNRVEGHVGVKCMLNVLRLWPVDVSALASNF